MLKIAPSIIYLRATTMAAAVEKFIERVPYRLSFYLSMPTNFKPAFERPIALFRLQLR